MSEFRKNLRATADSAERIAKPAVNITSTVQRGALFVTTIIVGGAIVIVLMVLVAISKSF